jgi:(p)ppGpp synthase/HD superfamily hydrolase
METIRTKLTSRFSDAMQMAYQLHTSQYRKGSGTPYIAHLLSVAALVLEASGDEEQAIAALLHDAVEDQGGLDTLHRIHERFGARVAAIVEGCSDSVVQPKPPWRGRKEAYLTHLAEASQDVRLVSLADKVHNARSLLRDLRQNGVAVFENFNGRQEGTLWYYAALVQEFESGDRGYLATELSRVVQEIVQLTQTTT